MIDLDGLDARRRTAYHAACALVANHLAGGNLMEGKLVVAGVMVLMSFLMVSTVKFRSFKDIKLSWRTVAMVALTLVACAVMAARFKPASVLVFLLAAYITIGLVETTIGIPRSIRGARQRRAERRAARPSAPTARTVDDAEPDPREP